MCIKGGYKAVTPVEISNVLAALGRHEISTRAVRIYIACVSLVAIREAAQRSKSLLKKKGTWTPRYRIRELCGLTLLSQRTIRSELQSLAVARLLEFSTQEIHFSHDVREGSEELLVKLSDRRARTRPIPVPRTLLRHLAANSKKSVIVTALVYAARGLSLERSGEIKGAGTVKASWIADATGLSIRAVKSARKELISSGFISKDTGSFQKKLNRDGAYFRVNFSWNPSLKVSRVVSPLLIVRNNSVATRRFAPPTQRNSTVFAPPYKDKKTSSYEESKNQKTQSFAQKPAGVSSKPMREGNAPPRANIKNILRGDLGSISRMDALFHQATSAGWFESSEANYHNWLGAAVRANTTESRDPVRVFVSIVKRRDWHLITQEHEERVRLAIKKARNW